MEKLLLSNVSTQRNAIILAINIVFLLEYISFYRMFYVWRPVLTLHVKDLCLYLLLHY